MLIVTPKRTTKTKQNLKVYRIGKDIKIVTLQNFKKGNNGGIQGEKTFRTRRKQIPKWQKYSLLISKNFKCKWLKLSS